MNRHVQSAVRTLIHPDVPTSSAQTPYGQGTDAESLRSAMCVCTRMKISTALHVCALTVCPVAAVDWKSPI